MRISDVGFDQLVAAIAPAVSRTVYEGLSAHATAKESRDRTMLSAEIMGRIIAVLIRDDLGADVSLEIERCVKHMQGVYLDGEPRLTSVV